MTERPVPPPMPTAASRPPWTSPRLVFSAFAVAFVFALAALVGLQRTTDWPRWSGPAVLVVLCVVAWAAGRTTRSDRWAVVWDCSLFVWLSGALIVGGHLLLRLPDGLLEDAVVTWGAIALLLLWRRWQVRRGVRESMEAPIGHHRAETRE